MRSPDRQSVTDAVITMAGSGSRLRASGHNTLKPLTPIHGRPLVSYTIDALAAVGIRRIVAVVGFENESMIAGVKPLVPAGIEIQFVQNPDWQKQNGISILAAAPHVQSPFLLTMGDHLFDESIVDLLSRESDLTKVNLAVDRKIGAIFDLGDAMKVQTREDHVIAIAKNLSTFDAIDTGMFVCSPEVFQYLKRAVRDGDCHLADGLRLMADDTKVRAIDIGNAWWQDVDDAAMLQQAEAMIGRRTPTKSSASK